MVDVAALLRLIFKLFRCRVRLMMRMLYMMYRHMCCVYIIATYVSIYDARCLDRAVLAASYYSQLTLNLIFEF